jgi:hypothetical protein
VTPFDPDSSSAGNPEKFLLVPLDFILDTRRLLRQHQERQPARELKMLLRKIEDLGPLDDGDSR